MFLAEHLAEIDRLLARAPGPQTAVLRTSGDFWEDDGTARLAAEEELGTDCDALVTLLSRRWGEPETLDLTEHLLRAEAGEPVREPLRSLCGCVTTLRRWSVGGRWVGVGMARHGREQPLQLVAAVGEER
ncbi:hypothetical protein DVA86_15080 [Streptomyces armeniacus]|uniref:Uncharacterized protein n=1 Tax=Streptomyces armeniacus TaxID=83291 RepID=A0A345XQ68_9ACTN|nr:hypothetical protein [Streptomyces armeniacus]AXK33784.1 hypothetical protein DVA86_15080 [Streptomyces armeniacus]